MAYSIEKNSSGDNEIVWSGFENGIAVSPHKGIANIQNANLSTETGEVLASFARSQVTETSTNSTGSLSFFDAAHVSLSLGNSKLKGTWISVSASSHTGELPNGTYYVQISTGGSFQLATSFTAAATTGFTAGLTAVISLIRTVGQAVGYATETYFGGGNQFYRYYVLDNQGLVWVFDSINDDTVNDLQYWFLPDTSISYWGSDTAPSGLGVINGVLFVFSGNKIWVKYTNKLGTAYTQMTNAVMMSTANSANPHFGFTGHQGRLYYTDGSFLGSIFPNTSLLTGVANVQSYGSYAGGTTDSTITNLDSGTTPSTGANKAATGFSGIPAVFYTAVGGTLPSAITANVVYYIAYSTVNANFSVYDTLAHANAGGGTGRIDMSTGAAGTQYFTTFDVIGTHAGAYGDTALMTFSPARLALPIFEVAQCLAEVNNNIIIGCRGSVVYPWNQVDPLPGGIINVPEANVKQLLTVNQIAYIFAGYKGNIYVTDGSTASLVTKVPDYCAGIAGTPSTYIEPIYTWGGAAYIRGKIYFSVLDQTSGNFGTKAGNCGGIWSFYPTQNLAIDQDTGLALHLENQNSYGDYNGYATVIIPWFDQSEGHGPQFWSCWVSSLSSATYGFDKTSTSPQGSPYILETDLVPVGSVLKKYTPKQIEYKLAAALAGGESVTMAWRKNATDAYTSAGTAITPDGATNLSGYFNANFQGAQWVQLKFTGTAAFGGSFVRLTGITMR